MPNTTGVICASLQPGLNLQDTKSTAGALWQELMTTWLDQDGCQRVLWGIDAEKPGIIRVLVDWDSIGHHEKFRDHPAHGPFMKTLTTILDGRPSVHHVELEPHPTSAALPNGSMTEIATMYFPLNISSEDKGKVETTIKKLDSLYDAHAEGYRGVFYGWVIQELSVEHMEGKAKAFTCVGGWESLDAHTKFMHSDAFQQITALMMEMPQLRYSETCHVALTEAARVS